MSAAVIACERAPEDTHLAPPNTSLCALVVEDEADARANMQSILELDDWRVEVAGTMREALDRTNWSEITVVILDRTLPDGDSAHLLPVIRQRAPQAAVIVVTGFADLNDAILALRYGAADYLLKPINPDALRASVARIVEGKRTELALFESQERLRQERDFAETLLQTAQTIVLLRDTEGQILRINPFFEEITGCALEEARGVDYFKRFVPENERAQIRSRFREALRLGRGSWLGPLLDKSGQVRRIHWSAKVLSDGNGQTIGLLTCGLDITDLERSQQKAVQAERLAAIGQMMAGLAHESRNALQRSKACLEMLTLEVEDRPEALDLVSRIQRAQEHLAMLYEEVRQYAAPINLRWEAGDLRDSWREVWADLSHVRASAQIELCEEIAQIELTCHFDRFAIGQVWRNIFENAIQVSPKMGRITLRCAEADIEGRAAVRISIADQGPGMTSDQRKRVFEPFFTTKTKGTGLGMAIAYRIVSSHGGTIEVTDREGPGAEFIVVLPRAHS